MDNSRCGRQHQPAVEVLVLPGFPTSLALSDQMLFRVGTKVCPPCPESRVRIRDSLVAVRSSRSYEGSGGNHALWEAVCTLPPTSSDAEDEQFRAQTSAGFFPRGHRRAPRPEADDGSCSVVEDGEVLPWPEYRPQPRKIVGAGVEYGRIVEEIGSA